MYLTLRQNICLWNADGLFNILQHRNNSSHYLKYVSGKHKHQIWAFENSLFAHRFMRSHICEEINIFGYRNTLDRLTAPVTWVWNKVSQSFKTYQTAMPLFFQRKARLIYNSGMIHLELRYFPLLWTSLPKNNLTFWFVLIYKIYYLVKIKHNRKKNSCKVMIKPHLCLCNFSY